MIPIKSIGIMILSFIWLGISIKQWWFEYPDLSSMVFSTGFFLLGMYIAYDQWFKDKKEKYVSDIEKDIMAINKKCDSNENHIITIRNERE